MKIDLFALFIFLGVAQGFFLGFVFYFYNPHKKLSNKLLALLMCAFAVSIGEIFLCYTNIMFQTLWLVDIAEPLNFALAPLLHLYIQSRAMPEKKHITRAEYLHFLPFLCYFLYMAILVFPQGTAYKYNCYINAYHPKMPRQDAYIYWAYPSIFWVRDHVSDFTFLHLFIYQTATIFFLLRKFSEKKLSILSNAVPDLAWARNVSAKSISIVVLFLVIKLTFDKDLGDHILAAHIALVIYMIGFHYIKQSISLHTEAGEAKAGKKYEKSSLTEETQAQILQKLDALMQEEKPYLRADCSLPALAQRLHISVHHLSQILNEQIGQNFFEFIATYRIKEAQNLLQSPNYTHLKIEEIAEMVGYNSKSSFNTTFKKITGQTPSAYRKQ